MNIGLIKNEEEGRLLCEALDAATLKKRQSWYKEALGMFTEQKLITAVQAEKAAEYVGLEPKPHSMQTPYDMAEESGVLSKQQAKVMNDCIFEKAHSPTALCSGSAANLYSEGETILDGVELSTELSDDSVIKAVNGAVVRLKNAKIHKRGDTTDHSEGSFTGLNAAVLAEGGKIYIEDSAITSEAIGGNNIFAHGEGSEIYLKNVLLDAYGAAASRCVYLAFGGRVDAVNCEFVSRGNISSAVATDTGGGFVNLDKCMVKAFGNNCAALYSTGRITARQCKCIAPDTEGLIIVGANSIELEDTYVFSGKGQGVKFAGGMPGEKGGHFSMRGGLLAICEGPVGIFIGTGLLELENVRISNPSGIAFAPGNMGQHMTQPGGDDASSMIIKLKNQTIEGDALGDKSHGLTVELLCGSKLTGAVNGDSEAVFANVKLDKTSVWSLTGDSFVGSLENEDESGSNIVLNGFLLTITVYA